MSNENTRHVYIRAETRRIAELILADGTHEDPNQSTQITQAFSVRLFSDSDATRLPALASSRKDLLDMGWDGIGKPDSNMFHEWANESVASFVVTSNTLDLCGFASIQVPPSSPDFTGFLEFGRVLVGMNARFGSCLLVLAAASVATAIASNHTDLVARILPENHTSQRAALSLGFVPFTRTLSDSNNVLWYQLNCLFSQSPYQLSYASKLKNAKRTSPSIPRINRDFVRGA